MWTLFMFQNVETLVTSHARIIRQHFDLFESSSSINISYLRPMCLFDVFLIFHWWAGNIVLFE